jgi:hypothetical protein
MDQGIYLQQLNERLVLLEQELCNLRLEIAALQCSIEPANTLDALSSLCVKNYEQQQWFNNLFASLDIQGKPAGILLLQKHMGQVMTDSNELSRTLIESREA